MVHSARGKWGIKANCPCTSRHTKPLVRPSAPNGISQVLLDIVIFSNFIKYVLNVGLMYGCAYLSSLQRTVVVASDLQPLVLAALQSQKEKHQLSKQKVHKQQYRQTAGVEKVSAVLVTPQVVHLPHVTTCSPLPRSHAHQERATVLLCTGWQTWPHRKPRMTPRVSRKEWTLNQYNLGFSIFTFKVTSPSFCHYLPESGSLRSMMSRDSRPLFGLDSLSALSKPSASSPKLFNSLLLGSSMAQSKPEGSSLRDLLNSGPGKLPQGPGESGVPFPSVFTSAGVCIKLLFHFVLWSVQESTSFLKACQFDKFIN